MTRDELQRYIFDHYSTEPDYPWPGAPNHAVFRHGGNRKWFALVLDVPRNKLGLPGTQMIDVVNLKCDSILIGSLRGEPGIFPAYHMNKDRWLSVALDGSAADDQIRLLLEQSAEGCRSPAVAELAGVQRDYSKRMEELLRDRLPRLMHGEEDPQEERAEAAALFAEYAIDFAAQGVRSALLAALAAMDQQMNCEEQQGKEHPV